MKIGCLTVLLLVVAVSSTPTILKKSLDSLPGRQVVKGHNKVVGFPYPCIKGYGVMGHLGYLTRGVRCDRASNAFDILRAVAGYKLPGSFDGSINVIIELGRAVGIFVDVIIPGLGQLLSNLVIGMNRILVCMLGSPSFFGAKSGDRRPGYGSASDNYFICHPNYGSKWGWKLFRKGYKHHSLILDSYGIRHAGLKADKLIKNATRGRGVDSLPYAQKLIVLWIRELCDLADRDINQWNKNYMIEIYIRISSMIGAFGRSCQRGLGVRIATGINVYIKTNFENYGLSGVGDVLTTINDNIGKFDHNSFGDVINPFDGDFVDDSKDDNTDAIVAKDDNDSEDTAVSVVTPTYDGSLRGIAKLLVRISNFKINLANDVFSLVFRLCFGISGLIDASISGLGSLLSRIIAVIFKIGICFKGFPGDRSICNKGWNRQFGVNGEGSTSADLIALFGLGNAKAELDGYINTSTHGKGTKAASGCMRIIFERCSSLCTTIKNYQQISKETIATTFVSVTTITAAIANANKKDSGKQITRLMPICGKNFKELGYPDITKQVNDIEIIINNANDDKTVDWTKDAGTNKDLDSGNDGYGATGNDNNNNGNTNDNMNNGGNNDDNSNNGANNNDCSNNGGYNNSGDSNNNNDNETGNSKDTGKETSKGTGTGNDKDNGRENDTGNGKDSDNDTYNGNGKDTGEEKDTDSDKYNGKGQETGKRKDTDNDKGNGKVKDCGKKTGKDTGNDKVNGKGQETGKGKYTGSDTNNGKRKDAENYTGKGEDTGKDTGKGKITGKDTGKDKNTNRNNTDSNKGNNENNTDDNNEKENKSNGNNTGNKDNNTGNGQGSGGTDIGVSGRGGGGSTDVVKGDGLVTCVKDLFKDVKKDKNIDQTTVTAVLDINIPRNFDGLMDFSIKVVQALGSIIDLFISGLGSILVRIFGCILRYIVCVSGGSRNSNTFVCQKAYFDRFGVTVSGDGWDDLANGFKVTTASNDVHVIRNSYIEASGSLSGSVKVCFDQIDALLKICSKGSKVSDDDMASVMTTVTILLGGFANSWSPGLGKQICDNMIPVTNSCLMKNNYPAFTSQNTIYVTIETATGDEAPWTKGTTTTVVNN
ncbi:uncharacterized protein [Choristoneura fumiferana]|uniref:uncharacterized protein n=1 Tax=Choristoneura fumiferana TaxID=7141 RepID=UPI003D157226